MIRRGGWFQATPTRPTPGQASPGRTEQGRGQPFTRTAPSVTLDANGYGYCTVYCPSGIRWDIDTVSVSTNASTQITQPVVCVVYQASSPGPARFKERTYFGNGNSSDTTYRLSGGEGLTAEWTGGTPGSIATLRVSGTQWEI